MAHKKYALMMLLASFALTLGACNTKNESQPASQPSSESQPASSDSGSPSSSSQEQKTVSSISIKDGTTLKTNYVVGDVFSVDGGRVIVNYSDHTRTEIDLTLAMVVNAPDMSVPHEDYVVNVSYEGASTSYIIQVISADTREEVTIGVAYDYNGGQAADMENGKLFYEGKPYHFYYGTNPAAARDSVSYKFIKLTEGGPVDLGTEKPTEVGNYTYTAFIADNDENYKPVSVSYDYSIIPTENRDFLLNRDNKVALTNVPGDATQTADGVTINYHNAKASDDNHLAILVKQSERFVNPDEADNYIEIASPVSLTTGLTVRFDDQVNHYVMVYGSYDGAHWYLMDTLTQAKQVTARANDFFFFRIVGAARTEAKEVNIVDISFTYEVDGAPISVAARAENSDLVKSVSQDEEGGFYKRSEVYDEQYSTGSIGERNQEISAKFDFGFELPAREVPFYTFQVKYKPLNVVKYDHTKEGGAHEDRETAKIYAKLLYHGATVGVHKNFATVGLTSEGWLSFTLNDETVGEDKGNFATYFLNDELTAVDGIKIWIDSKVVGTGNEGEFACVLFDDIRVVQKSVYPLNYSLESVAVSEMTTEFTKGDTFTFDGKITATYRDGSTGVIPNDNAGVSISSPDMSTSGTKTVNVSYTEDEITRKTSYTITVVASGNPKDEETLPIVAEADDLAKASNQAASGSSYDKGQIDDETEVTYGNSTNSIKISKLYSTCVSYHDTGVHASIHVPSVINKETVHVKFFAKSLDIRVDLELCDDTTPKAGSVAKASFAALTATDAGNGWVMYEYDFATNNKNVYLLKFKCADNSGEHTDFFYVDGLEIY